MHVCRRLRKGCKSSVLYDCEVSKTYSVAEIITSTETSAKESNPEADNDSSLVRVDVDCQVETRSDAETSPSMSID